MILHQRMFSIIVLGLKKNRLRPGQTKNNAYSKVWRENKDYYHAKINHIFEEGLFENLFFC